MKSFIIRNHFWSAVCVLLLLLPVVIAPVAAVSSNAPQAPWTVEAILKQLDNQSGDFHSLSADMERTKVTVVVNDKSTESGKVLVRRDDKMKIDLTQPDARTILRDGDQFYIYNPKIHRVEEYNLGKKKSLVDQFLLLGFGTSGNDLKKSYAISLEGEETLDGHKVVVLDLTPKSDDVRQQIAKIRLWIDESTWLPLQQKFDESGSGDYFIIHYRNLVRNVKIADSEFKPRWPKGVTRVKPQG
jgi:outer membrane lipoprotein-sorting protein